LLRRLYIILEEFLGRRSLPQKTGFQPSTLYGLIAEGKFPKPFKLAPGGRAAGWDEALIDAWITARVEECK
jgi:prophage regulatory protein